MVLLILGLGLIAGSFINAVVWRIKEGKSFITGRSMCPYCKHQLAAVDLVPVLSWVMLGGRCRYCKKPISAQYPLVELLTALLFAFSFLALGSRLSTLDLVLWLYFLTVLIILAVYDLHHYILPDKVLLPAIAVALLQIGLNAALGMDLASGFWQLVTGLVAGGAFYALAAVSGGRWLGGGDIKLAFLMGLLLGWPNIAVALLFAFNSAALIGLMLIAIKIKKRTDHIPFGPFLVAGTIIAMLYGDTIINWYLGRIV